METSWHKAQRLERERQHRLKQATAVQREEKKRLARVSEGTFVAKKSHRNKYAVAFMQRGGY